MNFFRPHYGPLQLGSSEWHKIWRILAVVSAFSAITFISVMPQISSDFWLQAKIGELIARDGAIPRTVLFPFTEIRNATFNAHEWLPSILFYEVIHMLGEDALPFVLGALCLILLGTITCLGYIKSEGNLPYALILGLIAVGVENTRNFLRPELLSLILLGLHWIFLERYRSRGQTRDWMFVLVVVVIWANTHGSFILAPIVAGIYAVGAYIDGLRASGAGAGGDSVRRAWQFFYVACTSLLSTLVTPFGWELLQFVFEFSNAAVVKREIIEWLPTFDHRFFGMRAWWIGVGATVLPGIAIMLFWRKLSSIEILMYIFFALLALKTVRFLVYSGMVAAFALAPLVPKRWGTEFGKIQAYGISSGLSLMVLALAMIYGNAVKAYPHSFTETQSFTQLMKKELNDPALRGNVITSYALGGELIYRAYPRLRPSIDVRVDSYGEKYFKFHQELFLDDELLKKFVRDNDVRYMLLDHADTVAFSRLPSATDGGWEVRLADRRHVLLERHGMP